MLLKVNGKEKQVSENARLGEVIVGEPYEPGATVAVTRSTSSIQKETNEFELVTAKGSLFLRLNGSSFAETWRNLVPQMVGSSVRWQSNKVLAVGSFPSTLEVDRGRYHYSKYDCYFSLGGFDNRSTYMMIAKIDHDGAYGVAEGRIGRITRGRHLLGVIEEGERIVEIRPVVLELSDKDAFPTKDMDLRLEEGMSVETYVQVDLDRRSPISCEQFLVVTGSGRLDITDRTSTYSGNSKRMDVTLIPEHVAVREDGDVTVRHEGSFTGRIYFYRRRRQQSPAHNLVGKIVAGHELVRLAPLDSFITILSNPSRIMTIGMTQRNAQAFLEARGLRQKRTGLVDDTALVGEQEPELTMEIKDGSEVETFGVLPEKVSVWELDDEKASRSSHYFRKMTGLDHKPIGTLKVFFTYSEMPTITFVGNAKEASVLLPENPFEDASPRGQVGITNMSRPNRGTIGIRLDGSPEFGPTGEERYGTNVVGTVLSDLGVLMRDIKDGDIVYLRERRPGEVFAPQAAEAPMKQEITLDEISEIARQAEFMEHTPPAGPFQGASGETGERKASGKEEGKKGGRPRAKRPKQE
ncbi:MAG: methanogenesis marker 3 protein [Methanomassiliicoccus sp.]|nr:methanogenesis marker 3 protein [Methanomassiliicoccus sp.]